MAENEKEEVVLGTQVMEIHPKSLGCGMRAMEDGRRALFTMPTPKLGVTLPLWEHREDMVALFRLIHPDHDSSQLAFVMVDSPDKLIAFAADNALTIIINPRVLDNGTLLYGRIAWN